MSRISWCTATVVATFVAIAACGGEPVVPKGRPCVEADADAMRRMRAHFNLSEESTAGFEPNPNKVDLDHDGQLDRIYTFEVEGATPLTVVYAMQAACGEPLGEIQGTVTVLPTKTRNFKDLKATSGGSWKICRLGDDAYHCAEP